MLIMETWTIEIVLIIQIIANYQRETETNFSITIFGLNTGLDIVIYPLILVQTLIAGILSKPCSF